MVFSPQVGLHSNIAMLDCDSENPNIIVIDNLRYETVTASGIERMLLLKDCCLK
jgi:DNA polymerase elongation subunit (family B)